MTNNVKVKQKGKKASLERKKARAGWIFILPFVIGFVFIYLPMLYDSISSSLIYRVKVGNEWQEVFGGFKPYIDAFLASVGGQTFPQALVSGVGEMVLEIPMILLFSLFMAVLLNQKMAGRAAFRAIFFVPVILSTGIMQSIEAGAIDSYMSSMEGTNTGSGQDPATGLVNTLDMSRLFSNMIIGDDMLEYVTDTINKIYDIVNRSGVQMLIFLAGLQSISPAIYESVQIDGATAWETFWKITFPMISPMILVNAVYTVIDAFTGESAIMAYIKGAASDPNIEGAATVSAAMSWIYFFIVILILAAIVGICSLYVFYQKKN